VDKVFTMPLNARNDAGLSASGEFVAILFCLYKSKSYLSITGFFQKYVATTGLSDHVALRL
jgi:hypothetical protein